MGLCLVSGKNSGFAVVDFSQGSTVAKRRNGLVFCVWVSVWFLAKILGLLWLIFPRGQQWQNEGMVWFSVYGSLFGF